MINEEMYEEEDDDLPLQYRRLTAHLQTGSADFNRRLAAYLTNQVAMRSAMEQMVHESNPQQYNAMSANYQNYQNMFQSPMLPQHHNLTQSPVNSYRAAPYPSPHDANFRQHHARANSTVVYPTNDQRSPSAQPMDQRRMSTPVIPHPGSKNPTQLKTEAVSPDSDFQRQTQSATIPQHQFPPMWQNMSPFTMSLPPESQQMLAPALDANDPFQAMLMSGSENVNSNPYFPWLNSHPGMKNMTGFAPGYPSMNATLSPAVLNNTSDITSTSPQSATLHQDIKNSGLELPSQGLGSGQVTPGENFWDNFIEDGGWTADTSTD